MSSGLNLACSLWYLSVKAPRKVKLDNDLISDSEISDYGGFLYFPKKNLTEDQKMRSR